MVKSMNSHSTLSESFWGEALKTAAYIFNRVPSKATLRTPYKVCISKKISLNHLHILGCLVEARPYKPNKENLDSKIVRFYFIRYFKRSRGYNFMIPQPNQISKRKLLVLWGCGVWERRYS